VSTQNSGFVSFRLGVIWYTRTYLFCFTVHVHFRETKLLCQLAKLSFSPKIVFRKGIEKHSVSAAKHAGKCSFLGISFVQFAILRCLKSIFNNGLGLHNKKNCRAFVRVSEVIRFVLKVHFFQAPNSELKCLVFFWYFGRSSEQISSNTMHDKEFRRQKNLKTLSVRQFIKFDYLNG
jgi:hypothetical protein